MMIGAYSLEGLGDTVAPLSSSVCPKATPGTMCDPACPAWCAFTPFSADLFNACWPCANICPSGKQWDVTNLQCSATPQTVAVAPNPAGDSPDAPQGCPGWCASIPFPSYFDQCAPCMSTYSGTPTIALVALVAGLALFGILRR